jgi:Na+-transporting NADH:ubiquinone oxidoreductase subunit C
VEAGEKIMSSNPAIAEFTAKLRRLASGHGSNSAVRLYTIGYVLVVTLVFTGAVATLNLALEATRQANEEASRQQTLLRILGCIEPGQSLDGDMLRKTFSEQVVAVEVESATMVGIGGQRAPYTYYHRRDDKGLRVIPLWGTGFWGFMGGYAALDTGSGELRGVEFIRHEETPGLGGRIGDEDVKARFVGRSYLSPDRRGRRIRMLPKGSNSNLPGAVDAITGATGTSLGVEKILNTAINRYLEIEKGQP